MLNIQNSKTVQSFMAHGRSRVWFQPLDLRKTALAGTVGNQQLPTLNGSVIGLTRERFVAIGLLSWTH